MSDSAKVLTYPQAPAYDWRKTVLKGLKQAGLALGSVALYGAADAIAHELTNSGVVTGLLGPAVQSHPWVLFFVPAIVGAAGAYENWRKNH